MTEKVDGISAEDKTRFERYGLVVLTTAVFAVILSAPAGAILVNSLGKKLLTYDGDDSDELEPNNDKEGSEIEIAKIDGIPGTTENGA